MKRLVIISLVALSASLPLCAYSGLTSELFYRSSSGTVSSSGVSNAYEGTELDVRITSASSWDGSLFVTLFGGAQRALSLTLDGIAQDLSSHKTAWYYGAGSAALINVSPYVGFELSVAYETAWQFMDRRELALDTLRVGVKAMGYGLDGFAFMVGFEYSRPLWGRLIDRRGAETDVRRFSYDANGFALSVGVGYQVW